MTRSLLSVVLRPTALLLGLVAPTIGLAQPMLGFDEQAAAEQRQREARLDELVDAAEIDSWVRQMTPRPHHVGAPQTEANARWMLEQFRSWGFEAQIETFEVLVPFPKLRKLEMVAPTRFVAGLSEEVVASDATSAVASRSGPFAQT